MHAVDDLLERHGVTDVPTAVDKPVASFFFADKLTVDSSSATGEKILLISSPSLTHHVMPSPRSS